MYKFEIKHIYFKITAICIGAIILLGFSYNFLKPKENIITSLEMPKLKQMVSYVKDNKIHFINSQGESILLYDKTFENAKDSELETQISDASNLPYYLYPIFPEKDTNIYFLGDFNVVNRSGTLYKYDKNKGIEKIDKQVKAIINISPDCKKIAYAKLNENNIDNSPLADLYIYETGKPNIKISENYSEQTQYNFSWKTNSVAYTEQNSETNINRIYIKKQFREKELVDEGMGLTQLFYSDDGNIIAYTKNSTQLMNDYYIKKSGEKPEHIVASKYVKLIPSNFSTYYISDDDNSKQIGNLYYKELNKAPIKITTGVSNIISEEIYNDYISTLKQKRVLFQKTDGMVYLVNENKAPQKIGELKTDERLILDKSGTSFIIFSPEGGKIKSGVYDNAKKSYVIKDIEDNARVLEQSKIVDSNKLLYIKKSINNDYEFWSVDLANNKKEIIQTGYTDIDNVFIFTVVNKLRITAFPQVIGNTIYYNFNNGLKTDLYIKKFGSKAIKIAETSGSFLSYGEDTVYYYVSSSDSNTIKYNLFVYKYGKGSELVASDVSRLN